MYCQVDVLRNPNNLIVGGIVQRDLQGIILAKVVGVEVEAFMSHNLSKHALDVTNFFE